MGHDISTSKHRAHFNKAIELASPDNLRDIEKQTGKSLSSNTHSTTSHMSDGKIGKWKHVYDSKTLDHVEQKLKLFGLPLDFFEIE